MTTDKEYSDMGMCPQCLKDGYDGTCPHCGHIETTGYKFMDDIQWPSDDYNYLKHSESD